MMALFGYQYVSALSRAYQKLSKPAIKRSKEIAIGYLKLQDKHVNNSVGSVLRLIDRN